MSSKTSNKEETSTTKIIDSKSAAMITIKYFSELTCKSIHEITIEEIELSSDDKKWKITLGYYETPKTNSIYLSSEPIKCYKEFSLDAITGKIINMKIKKI